MTYSHIKRFLPLIILTILMVLAFIFELHTFLSFEELQSRKNEFKDYVSSNPIFAGLIFFVIYTTFVALSLPVASLLTLLSGFLFGFVGGTLLVVSAATLGATAVFLVAKTSLGTTLREKAGGLYKKIEANMKENAFGYLLFMRLVPLFPFFLVNIVPALFNVRLRTYILTTFFGIMPGSAVYVYTGQQLGDIESVSDIASPQVIMAFVLLGLFALIPTIYKQVKQKYA